MINMIIMINKRNCGRIDQHIYLHEIKPTQMNEISVYT